MAPSGWALLGQIGHEMGGNELIGSFQGRHKQVSQQKQAQLDAIQPESSFLR
jgi:hypothetical protein